jgi:glycosyltransferase involved in cell wall biosynthesis
MAGRLVIVETHPVQYHAPVYRWLHEALSLPLTVIYGSDFSVAGYLDEEFASEFAWDVDLLEGYHSEFLTTVAGTGSMSISKMSAAGLDKKLLDLNPSAVLQTGYASHFHRQAFRSASRLSTPLLFRAETTDHAVNRGRFKAVVRNRALRILYSRFEALLYIGSRSKSHYLRLGVEQEKLFFSPYCVDTHVFQTSEKHRADFRMRTRRDLHVADDHFLLMFSGKMSSRKAPDLLLRAVKELPPHLRNRVVVLFVGDGEMRETLTQTDVSVRFTGFKNQSELSPYFHASDLLILPSRRDETWGLVVNEALLHGIPCVVSDAVGCGPDLVVPGSTGEIFANGSATGLANAIGEALSYSTEDDTRHRCRALVSDYSVSRAADGIAAAFESLGRRSNRS